MGYVEDAFEATCLREALWRRQGTKLTVCFSILWSGICLRPTTWVDWARFNGTAANRKEDQS